MHQISIHGYRRISKVAAMKRFNDGLPFALCPAKYVPGGSFAMHSDIFPESIQELKDHAVIYSPVGIVPDMDLWDGTTNLTAWNHLIREWSWYNLNGKSEYPAYYVREESAK